MTRINRNNIQLGESFVVSIEDCAHKAKIQEALVKEQEIILNAEQKAAEIVEQANQQAQQMIQAAEQEALSRVDAITQHAHNEGFEAGRQEGYADITKELQDKVIAVNDFAYSNFDIKNNIIKSAHSDIIRLVVEIAQKVCSTALELDDNILKELTLEAIRALKDKEDITIIVHPEMAQKIYAISDEFRAQIPQLSSIKIVEDASVSPDGTIVESPMSRVDSRVRSQINEIAERLMGKLDSTPLAEAKPPKEVIPPIEEVNIEQQPATDEGSRLGFPAQQQGLDAVGVETPTYEAPVIEEAGWASAHQDEQATDAIFITEGSSDNAVTENEQAADAIFTTEAASDDAETVVEPIDEDLLASVETEVQTDVENVVDAVDSVAEDIQINPDEISISKEQVGEDGFVDLVDQDIQVSIDTPFNQINEAE